jgi:hypothetical protein
MTIAEHIPMMSCLAKAGGRALERNEHVTTALAVMANSCMQMIKSKKYITVTRLPIIIIVMTVGSCIIVY